MNFRKHAAHDESVFDILDPRSSAAWLDGWQKRAGPWIAALRDAALVRELPTERAPVSPSSTWLGAVGWKRHGLIGPREIPSSAG
jgi:hypothetical protein